MEHAKFGRYVLILVLLGLVLSLTATAVGAEMTTSFADSAVKRDIAHRLIGYFSDPECATQLSTNGRAELNPLQPVKDCWLIANLATK